MEAKIVTRTCKTCGKGFSSSKAWVGHRRSHLQVARPVAEEAEALPPRMLASGFSKTVPCPVCKRGFSSTKAVAGHMRSHPEREWRGIHPPSPEEEELAPSVINAFDLSQALPPSWKRKERRSGAGKRSSLVDAANGLLELSQSGGSGSGGEWPRVSETTKKKKKKKSADPTTPPLLEGLRGRKQVKIRAVSETGTLLRIANAADTNYLIKGTKVITSDDIDNNYGGFSENYECLGEKKRKGSASCDSSNGSETETDEEVYTKISGANYKITHKNIHVSDDITSTYNNNAGLLYKCVECEKSFPTFQALGRHRSTHNKDLNNKRKSGENGIAISQSSREISTHFPILVDNNEKNLKICDEDRCHFEPGGTGSPAGLAGGPEKASPGLGSRGGPSRPSVVGFDLNEMPCDAKDGGDE